MKGKKEKVMFERLFGGSGRNGKIRRCKILTGSHFGERYIYIYIYIYIDR